MTVESEVRSRISGLTPAELRVAESMLAQPQSVAFGTVAELARLAETSGATVVRFATKLSYDGFIGLQEAIQEELASQLGPAAERIRVPVPDDVIGQVLTREMDNLEATFHNTDRKEFEQAVRWLADPKRRVILCPGDCVRGVAVTLADQLLSMRPDVHVLDGSQVRVGRELAQVSKGDVVLTMDFRRYDRWVLVASDLAKERGAKLVAFTDSRLGPLARAADCIFVVSAGAVGPFDSQVATLALGNALVAAVAEKLRPGASERLDRVEGIWQRMDALVDRG
jgi:DNA-binding MurR/RpiR family transcriptional regulator